MSASACSLTWRPAASLAAVAASCCLGLGAACTGSGGLDDPDPDRRAAAVRALATQEPARALPALLVAQGDASAGVRLAAAESFTRLGGTRAAEGLGGLLADVEPEVVSAAARGLASLPPEAGAKARLLAAYAGAAAPGRAAIAGALDRMGVALREAVEAEARVLWERNLATLERAGGPARAGAAEELGESGRTEAVSRLLTLLEGPGRTDARLAAAAARGLGAAGHRGARPKLELLLEGRDRGVAESAALALGTLGDPGAADALAAAAEAGGPVAAAAMSSLEGLPKAPEVAAALCAVAVRSADPTRAAAAARLVSLRDQPCPVAPLLNRMGRPGEMAALAALGELRLEPAEAESAAQRVLAYLASTRGPAEVRAAAARAAAGLGWAGAIAPLATRAGEVAKRLGEARTKVPFLEPGEAIELGGLLAGLGRLRAREAEPLLRSGLRDPSPAVRAGAAEGLADLVGSAAAEAIGPLLRDPDEPVRLAAARALGHLGPAGAGPLAQAATATRPEDAPWRGELARALGDAGGPEATTGLLALLDGGSTAQAAAALGRLSAAGAARALMERIAGPHPDALPLVLDALSQLGGAEAGPTILPLLSSDRPDVREAAVRALGRLRFEPAAPWLESLRSDYFGRIRRAAVEALARLPVRRPTARP